MCFSSSCSFSARPINCGFRRSTRLAIVLPALAAMAFAMVPAADAQVFQYYWKDNAGNGNWDWGSSQWYGTQTNGLVGAPNYNGGAQLFFENAGNTTTTINAGGGTGGAPAGWIGLNAIFTQNASAGKVYTINSGTGINGIYLYNKIETLSAGTPAGLIINSQVQLGLASEINAVAANIQLGNLLLNGNTLNSFGNKQLNITGVISGAGTFNIKNQGLTATFSGTAANTFSGTTTVENSSLLVLNKSANTAAIAGPLVINAGAAARTDAAGQLSNQLVTANGTLNLAGNSQSAALAGSGSVTLGSATLTLTNTATDTFSGIISGTGALQKQSSGTQILSGGNSYSGATTVSGGTLEIGGAAGTLTSTSGVAISGGTLLLSGSNANRINNSATVSLGGTVALSRLNLSTSSVPETVGALSLASGTGARVIDFGSSGGALTFASIASAVSGLPLQIWNWSGTTGSGGGVDRLIATGGFGSNITLADISFFSGANGTGPLGATVWAGGGTSGELVPIPEPASLLAGLALLAPLAWRERRQWLRVRHA